MKYVAVLWEEEKVRQGREISQLYLVKSFPLAPDVCWMGVEE